MILCALISAFACKDQRGLCQHFTLLQCGELYKLILRHFAPFALIAKSQLETTASPSNECCRLTVKGFFIKTLFLDASRTWPYETGPIPLSALWHSLDHIPTRACVRTGQ